MLTIEMLEGKVQKVMQVLQLHTINVPGVNVRIQEHNNHIDHIRKSILKVGRLEGIEVKFEVILHEVNEELHASRLVRLSSWHDA